MKINESEMHVSKQECVCTSSRGLFVPNRQASAVVAGLLFGFFAFFMGGYFWGRQTQVQDSTEMFMADSLADEIAGSLCCQFDDEQAPSIENSVQPKTPSDDAQKHAQNQKQTIVPSGDKVEVKNEYYAQLIGFGTKKFAQRCLERMKKHNFPVKIVIRTSTTARGKVREWFQIVTERFSDYNELEELVERIEKKEKITGAQIKKVT